MARPPKKGLDYFPRETDYYQDEKIIDLMMKYGPVGLVTYDVLTTMVYRNGYYIELSPSKAALLVVRTVGEIWYKKNGMTAIDFAAEIIRYCAEIGLYSKTLVRQDVITSVGIQQRYACVTARNKVDKTRYWLLGKENSDEALESAPKKIVSDAETQVSVTKTAVSASEMPQIKENKIKVNKTKLKKMKTPPKRRKISSPCRVIINSVCDIIIKEYSAILPMLPKAAKSQKLMRNISDLGIGMNINRYRRLFEAVKKSTFLMSQDNTWKCDIEWLTNPVNAEKVLSGKYDDFKPVKSEIKVSEDNRIESSFSTDDFFEAALRHAYGEFGTLE